MLFMASGQVSRALAGAAVLMIWAGAAAGGNPFAAEVIGYEAGTGVDPSFTDPSSALGAPTRFTGELAGFPSVVSPFSPAFGTDEILSVGFGGSLTLRFDAPISDAASNPFGVDFIVFANAGFADADFPNGSIGDDPFMFGTGAPVLVEASADGTSWESVQTRTLDLFPTLGYRDAGPFDGVPGSDPTNFRVAMDPSLGLADFAGLDYAEVLGLYGRSGGGIGFDLGASGLSEAMFLRFTHAGDLGQTFQIDGVSIVPAPTAVSLMGLGLCAVLRRRRAAA